jgi:hypothetical protein
MLTRLFRTSIPYGVVRIYNRKWVGAQSDTRAVAPDGNLYIPPGTWFEEDFSMTSDIIHKHTFVHEMAHVWQYHRSSKAGMMLRGIRSVFNSGYSYKLDAKKLLADYSLEAQANILADYYFLQFEATRVCSQGSGGCGTLNEYRAVLKDFLANPNDRNSFIKPNSSNASHPYAGYH